MSIVHSAAAECREVLLVRFVWAVVAFVLATVMIGAGIAQRTILQGPKIESQSIRIDQDAPYLLVDGAVLNRHDGTQTFRAQADGTVFAAYGRTDDLTTWLTRTDYTHVTLDDEGEIVTTPVAAAEPVVDDEGAAVALTPSGSDLWLDEFQQEDVLITALQLPDEMSLLVATDGVAAAPSKLSVTWPTGVTTPWAGPLILGGGILMAVGIVLYILAVRHVRRSRGPRRKGLPMPETQPIDLAVEKADKGVISATPTRRQLARGKRSLIAVPAAAVTVALLSGCSADAWPDFASTPTPTSTDTIIVPAGQDDAPAVTENQAQLIIARVAETVAQADEDMDADLAAQRLEGAALAERKTNYRLREKIEDQAALSALPASAIQVLLPEAYDGWPRTFFAVVSDSATGGDTIMSFTQQDAWSPYRLSYVAGLVADATLNVAPAYLGAKKVQPDSPFLLLAPQTLAAAYADVIDNGDESEYAAYFDETTDSLRAQVVDDRAKRLEELNETGSKTAKMSFAAAAGAQEPVSLATLDSGAIVAVTVNESETVQPTNEDAVIKLTNNKDVETLAGVSQSSTGFTTTFADQIFFFVPAQSSSERIQILGYSSNILDAKVVKK